MASRTPPGGTLSGRTPLLAHDASLPPRANSSRPNLTEQGSVAARQWVFTVDDAVDRIGIGLFQWIMFVLVGMAFLGEAAKQTVVAFIAPVVGVRLTAGRGGFLLLPYQ